jgi:hypothetical protein
VRVHVGLEDYIHGQARVTGSSDPLDKLGSLFICQLHTNTFLGLSFHNATPFKSFLEVLITVEYKDNGQIDRPGMLAA